MRRFLITILTINVYLFTCMSQDIKWNTGPGKGYVFEINNKEAKKLLTSSSPDTFFNRLLYKLVDTFDVKNGWTNRPSKGHFVLAKIIKNKLWCEYTCVFPYQVFLMKEYETFALQVLDLNGNVRSDAKVKMGMRIRFDKESKTYRIDNRSFLGNEEVVSVELDGFKSFFNVRKHDVSHWFGNNYRDNGPSFYSYMVTDKNKYKPNDEIRFKSYALSHVKTPLRKELDIWLNGYGKNIKIGKLSPHRPGSYAGGFLLHDSLKLVLDKEYTLHLRERKGRIVAGCSFKYEDYELFGNKLHIKLEKRNHFSPENNELTITATDVNGLILKDAKASILVKTQSVQETFQPLVILPDTLMFKQIDLDPNGPTKVSIPSGLFQKTNTSYQVYVTVLNSQNERIEKMETATCFYSHYEITSRFSNDSICFDILDNGMPLKNVPVKIRRNNEREGKEVMFPYKEKLNPLTSALYFESKFASKQVTIANLNPALELKGGINKGGFSIKLFNPQKLEVSWYVYQGENLLQKGFGKEFEYNSLIEDRTRTFYVELLYSFGGLEQIKRFQYEFREESLNVSLDIPERVYPGQNVEAAILVSNPLGEPVSGVDLTAFSVTSKLNYLLPDLPYYGSSSIPRSKKAHYTKHDINSRKAIVDLNYKKWEKLARLDTMKYYQFTYPAYKPFIYSAKISDSTQFAPYVMHKGLAKQIYVVEVNHNPVYFSWGEQPSEYSFYVLPIGKKEISLRLSDRVIVLDSMSFKAGTKTILSIDLDNLPFGTRVYKLSNEFSKTEASRYTNFISEFSKPIGVLNAYLESDRDFFPLFSDHNLGKSTLIVGPLAPGKKTYIETPGLKTTFNYQGGYRYTFEDNIVYKLNTSKLLPKFLYDNSYDPLDKVNGLVINKKRFFERKPLISPKWLTRVIDVVIANTRLKVRLPHDETGSGVEALIFENTRTKNTISPRYYDINSNGIRFYELPEGLNNIVVLYSNGTYLKMDSINIAPHRHIVMNLNHAAWHARDSFSESLMIKHYRAGDISYNIPRSWDATSPPASVVQFLDWSDANIRGKVLSNTGEPLIGVSIYIKEENIGTVSDQDGRFALRASSRATLVFSYIGFASKEVEVIPGSEITMTLEEDMKMLQEVVVVGYGASKMVNLSGSVSGISIGGEPDVHAMPEERIPEESPSNAEQQLYQELLTLNTIRSNFSDVGFWEPRLFTDKSGMSKFSVTFPDDITNWNAIVYAMNRRANTGTIRKNIKSYKPLMAELSVPQFLTRGDSAHFLGKVLNYTKDSIILGKVKWSGARTDFEKDVRFAGFHVDKLPVYVSSTDSITTSYLFMRNDGYMDGEERSVSVVDQGIERAEGTLSILKNGDQRHIKSLHNETTTVEILDNQVQVYGGEVHYLLNYRYACNEQLASKLIGLINHKFLMAYERKPFSFDKDVNKIIERLLKNQNNEFLWSWWDVSPNTSYWMSAHILRALKYAKDAGYKVNLDIENITRKALYKYSFLKNYDFSDIDLLHSLAQWNAKLNYQTYISALDSLISKMEYGKDVKNGLFRYSYLKEKFLLLETRQILGLPYRRDSLLKYKKEGIMGDVYFSDDKPSYYWYNDEMTANIIAYRFIKNDSVLNSLRVPMQMYFLGSRKNGGWNTYQSSNVLMSVLPDLLQEGFSKGRNASINLSGKLNDTIRKFPFRIELQPGEELNIHKKAGMPVFYMQYVKERVTEAKTGVEGFKVQTYFNDNKSLLEAGKPVTLNVEVEVIKDATFEHVMIDVPIPGACSYADKRRTYSYGETHREYFKERTVIFCEKMRPGKYTFAIQLLPRFTGKYILNPAQVSLMYIPVVNANTGMKRVEVR